MQVSIELIKRLAEILLGVGLCLLGLLMLLTPGPGVATLIAGIMFISPWHGRRAIWWIAQSWRWTKTCWHGVVYDRLPKWAKINRHFPPEEK